MTRPAFPSRHYTAAKNSQKYPPLNVPGILRSVPNNGGTVVITKPSIYVLLILILRSITEQNTRLSFQAILYPKYAKHGRRCIKELSQQIKKTQEILNISTKISLTHLRVRAWQYMHATVYYVWKPCTQWTHILGDLQYIIQMIRVSQIPDLHDLYGVDNAFRVG